MPFASPTHDYDDTGEEGSGDRLVRYEHCYSDGGMVTYTGSAPTPGQGGCWEEQTSMYNEERRMYIPILAGFSCPRYSDDPGNFGMGDYIPVYDEEHALNQPILSGENDDFADIDMMDYDDAVHADLQQTDDIDNDREEWNGIAVLSPVSSVQDRLQWTDAINNPDEEWDGIDIVYSQEHAISEDCGDTQYDALMAEEPSSGSDWSMDRRQVERDRASKRKRGRPYSDTEADDEDDYHDMLIEQNTCQKKGWNMSRNRISRNRNASVNDEDSHEWQSVDVINSDGGIEDDLGENIQKKYGRLCAEGIKEIEEFGRQVQAFADELAKKWKRSRPDVLYRAGLGLRLARSLNSANQYRQWYRLHHKKPKDCE